VPLRRREFVRLVEEDVEMNRIALVVAILCFSLAVIVFMSADAPRRWYSGIFFLVLGAVMLGSVKRRPGATEK